jgi:hypothetical protein
MSFPLGKTGALVHFGDELTKACPLFDDPVVGSELDGVDLPEGRWFVDRVALRDGEQNGVAFIYEIWARRVE